MPNHTSNNLVITGPTADVRAFVAAVKSKTQEFDFNGVVPMPAELKGTNAPVKIQTAEEIAATVKKWQDDLVETGKSFENNGPIGLGMTQERHDELIIKHGCADWYSWCVANWGTKWGAYDDCEWQVVSGDNGNSTASIGFCTAWAPPCQFFVNASAKFPTLTFDLEFADEGGGFVGESSFADGDITEDVEYGWDSEKGILVRNNLGYGPMEDDLVDEDAEVEVKAE